MIYKTSDKEYVAVTLLPSQKVVSVLLPLLCWNDHLLRGNATTFLLEGTGELPQYLNNVLLFFSLKTNCHHSDIMACTLTALQHCSHDLLLFLNNDALARWS
jgi:hypothetical protein